jgi:hypothetical protein
MTRIEKAIAIFLIVVLAWLMVVVVAWSGSTPSKPNGSSDGRVHTCGYVTDDGVTENLAAYWQRCGRSNP